MRAVLPSPSLPQAVDLAVPDFYFTMLVPLGRVREANSTEFLLGSHRCTQACAVLCGRLLGRVGARGFIRVVSLASAPARMPAPPVGRAIDVLCSRALCQQLSSGVCRSDP